jgi:phosphatidylglycerol:prolipoprotein diacylglycerol transferase
MNWYGFLIGMGILAGVGLGWFVAKMRGHNPDMVFDAIIWAGPLAIVGTRLYFVIGTAVTGRSWGFGEIFGFVDGTWKLEGLAIHGGIIGAILGLWIASLFAKRAKKKETFLNFVDIGAPFMLLGQAIGRWGNYFNDELYGFAVSGTNRPFPFYVLSPRTGQYHVALFFWEFMFNLLGAIILLWMFFGKRRSAKGVVFFGYMFWYGTVRVILEPMRYEGGSMGWWQYVMCGTMIAIGIFGFIWTIAKAKKRNAKKMPFFVKYEDWHLTGLPMEEFGAQTKDYIKNLKSRYKKPSRAAAVAKGEQAAKDEKDDNEKKLFCRFCNSLVKEDTAECKSCGARLSKDEFITAEQLAKKPKEEFKDGFED